MISLFKKKVNLELPVLPGIERVTTPVVYPSGVAVETPDGIYLIKGKTRFKFYSDRALASWCVDLLPGTKESLSKMKFGGTLGFRSGTLIQNITDNRFYLISDSKRRHITSPDVFEKYGFDINNVMVVSEKETNLHEEGEALS